MKIDKSILHILDIETGNLILSHGLLNLNDYDIKLFMEKLLLKVQKSDFKKFKIEPNIIKNNIDEDVDFIDATNKIASTFFEVAKESSNIRNSNLLFFLGENELFGTFLAFIKLDNNERFVHDIKYDNNTLTNGLIKSKNIVQSHTQAISDAFIINLSENEAIVIEKKYTYNGEDWLISKDILGNEEEVSTVKENIKSIKNTVDEVSKKYNNDLFETTTVMQQAIYESIEMESKIDSDYVADKIFEDNISAKLEFQENLKEKGIEKVVTVPNSQFFEKKYRKQKINLGNGIEITVPIELLKNKDVIEFSLNKDGSSSIIIKNIDKILNKFN